MLSPDKNTAKPEGGSPGADREWVTLARVVRPRGLKGELLAELLTDFPERFADRRRLFLRYAALGPAPGKLVPREVTLQRYRLQKDRLVLKFLGVDSIEDAEPLRGCEVVIPRAERAPLDEDSVYIGDLSGCRLHDRASGTLVGEILDVDRESSNLPLIVVRRGLGELLIPFAKAYLPHIDLEARRMDMTLPEGLLDLNAALTEEERLEREEGGAVPGRVNLGRKTRS
jgi:16S rRNA processing protein RimM